MFTKSEKALLRKVCKVLFPSYRKLLIGSTNVTFHSRTSKDIPRWWKISITELMNYQLPLQLAMFKYNNDSFINVIVNDLVSCDLNNRSRLDYFYQELVKLKFAPILHQLQINTITTEFVEVPIKLSRREKEKEPLHIPIKRVKTSLSLVPTEYIKVIGNDVIACFILTIVFVLILILQ